MPRSPSGLNPFTPPIQAAPAAGGTLVAALMLLAAIGAALAACPRVLP